MSNDQTAGNFLSQLINAGIRGVSPDEQAKLEDQLESQSSKQLGTKVCVSPSNEETNTLVVVNLGDDLALTIYDSAFSREIDRVSEAHAGISTFSDAILKVLETGDDHILAQCYPQSLVMERLPASFRKVPFGQILYLA